MSDPLDETELLHLLGRPDEPAAVDEAFSNILLSAIQREEVESPLFSEL